MSDAERPERPGRLSAPRRRSRRARGVAIAVIVALATAATTVVTSTTVATTPAGASPVSNERAKAIILYHQIQGITSRVGVLGQRYDEAHVKLERLNNLITNTKSVVASIQRRVTRGSDALRADAVFIYVTNGAAASNNPLFASRSANLGALNVYSRLAQGDIATTLANLANYRLELTQERSILTNQDRQAGAAERTAAQSFHESQGLQRSLQQSLRQVKGQIAAYINQQQAAAAAASRATLSTSAPVVGFPAPPPNPRAAIAIRTALSFLGVPYVWGGASRAGVDCSGLIMLAYDAAGIYLPHFSGAQFADTVRVPLYDLQPGDLLFYGYNGDEHVAMYLGRGEMIEAPYTGAVVHITPVRLGYGFAGAGRPRA